MQPTAPPSVPSRTKRAVAHQKQHFETDGCTSHTQPRSDNPQPTSRTHSTVLAWQPTPATPIAAHTRAALRGTRSPPASHTQRRRRARAHSSHRDRASHATAPPPLLGSPSSPLTQVPPHDDASRDRPRFSARSRESSPEHVPESGQPRAGPRRSLFAQLAAM